MSQQTHETDRSATFVVLLAASERQLTGFVLALLPNLSDADEVLQETKLRLWEQFDNYDPTQSFDGWARSIAYFQVLTHRKKSSSGRMVFSTELVAALADEFDDRSEEISERAQALQSCLEQLSGRNRMMLDKYYSGSWSTDSLAQAMGMTVAALRKGLYRCRLALHECIGRRLASAAEGRRDG
jgi:RNA polymerase sigma-70 factor (ECF subfamily)